MKEFKLSAWTDLPGAYQRTVYRRLLSDLSHRFISEHQLVANCGASRSEVREFLHMLHERGLLVSREATPDSLFGPLGGWLRRTFSADGARH